MIEAVIFDLGDTIINFGKVDKTGAIKQAARLSYEYLKEHNQPVGSFWSYFLRNMLEIRWRCIWSDITGKDFDSFSVMKKNGKKRGFTLTKQQWLEVNWLWYKPLAALEHIESDIKETVSKLKEMGLSLGILSNTFVGKEALDRHLEEIGIKDDFEMRMFSCYHPYRKPDKRIFLDAAERMSLKPEQIVFVGDRLDTDAAGALAANMKCVIKKSHANEGKQLPQTAYAIETLSELPQLVKKIKDDEKQAQ